MTRFWAKTTQEGLPGISVFDHMVNVGWVALRLSELAPKLLDRFKLSSSLVAALAALHDLGKLTPGFQRKCEVWLNENGLEQIARNNAWDTSMESDHGKVSHAAIQKFLLKSGIKARTAKFVAAVLGAHHGRLTPPNDRGYRSPKLTIESISHIDWDAERMANAQMIWSHFDEPGTNFDLSEDSPALWWLAGLTSVSDWIGSDERFFSSTVRDTFNNVGAVATSAIGLIGLCPPKIEMGLGFKELFDFSPNDMQVKALSTITGPGVYVIEAPMGMGKTEAALGAAYHLMSAGKAYGIYFALPTQTTSNRMHRRMNDFLRRIAPDSSASRIVHGQSWLIESDLSLQLKATEMKGKIVEDARDGQDWFASAKRALIAPFGVGTVDQALLGVVAAKHFFVRHFALAGKVVILDEIHSYDLYTGTLIEKLITTLEALGCTVIVLSATLTGKRREQIVFGPNEAPHNTELSYPLITGRVDGNSFEPAAVSPPHSRFIKVEFTTKNKAAEEAIKLALRGGAILWICNTIDEAQKQYQRLMERTHVDFPIGLLHSRFPFWRREEVESQWMGRFGKKGTNRCGSILVSTQVVEQSVDLDADLLITELAPTDMLLQRLGRLWRHERENRPADSARICILEETNSLLQFQEMEPRMIIEALGAKGRVYAPYVLLRSLEVWHNRSEVFIPSQIRMLLESTYEDRENESGAWQELSYEWFGTDSAKIMLASRNCNLWGVALEDEEGVQTRINEMPTIALVLCQNITKREAVFIDGSRVRLDEGQYKLATAQAIHKNLIKVPEYCFDRVESCPAFTDYLHGKHSVGVVARSGAIQTKGLKHGIHLFYSDELGLVIKKSPIKEEI
jgi:CRISPR-associated endonuclease/helicase Cas3